MEVQGEGSGVEALVLGFQTVAKRDLKEVGCGDGMRLEGEGEDEMEGERRQNEILKWTVDWDHQSWRTSSLASARRLCRWMRVLAMMKT